MIKRLRAEVVVCKGEVKTLKGLLAAQRRKRDQADEELATALRSLSCQELWESCAHIT